MRRMLQTFVDYLKHKYGPIQIDDCVAQMMNDAMERPTRQAYHIGQTENSGTQRGRQ
jgi:hypothetical protein